MKSTLTWQGAHVAELRDLTPTVREFVLAPTDAVAERWAPGAHLQVRLGTDGREFTRNYSLVGSPEESPGYRIAVKRLDDGLGGSRAMWQLAVGDAIEVGTPQNHFPLGFAAPATLLVAGGIGITPMVSMAQALARGGHRVRLLYAARSESELAYGETLRELLGEGLVTCVSSRGERLDLAGEIDALSSGAQAYVCGPAALLDEVRSRWLDAGRPLPSLRFEKVFASSCRATAPGSRCPPTSRCWKCWRPQASRS